MSRVSLGAALATFAIGVSVHTLDADIQTDGPKLRPKQQVLTVGDATVTLDMDRGVMPAGGKASVTLVATSERPHEVTLQLRAMEDMGIGAERVANPPKQVDSRSITLEAQPGGGPPRVETFTLAKHTKAGGQSEWFDIIATARGQKDAAASVGVRTWSGNTFAMTIEPPVKLPAEGDFTVAVRMKNTAKKPLPVPYVQLGAEIRGPEGLDSEGVTSSDDYEIEEVENPGNEAYDDDGQRITIAPGAEALAIFKIKPRFGIDHFMFVAQAYSEGGGAMATLEAQRPEVPDADPSGVQVSRR